MREKARETAEKMIRVGQGRRRAEIRGRERERETARRQRRRYYGRSHPKLSRARPNLVSSRCAHATRSGRSSRRRSSSSTSSVSSSCVASSNGTSDVYGGKPRFPSESELLFPPSERSRRSSAIAMWPARGQIVHEDRQIERPRVSFLSSAEFIFRLNRSAFRWCRISCKTVTGSLTGKKSL